MIKLRSASLLLSLLVAASAPTLLHAQEGTVNVESPVPFKGVARLHKLSQKTKLYTAESIYPTFRTSTRLTRFVNQTISSKQKKIFNDWLKDSKKALKEFPEAITPYEYTSGPSMTFYSPSRLISLRFDSYEFMGGAHGMGIMDARNFGIIGGKPKQLVLGDLFKPGSDYRDLVESQVFAKLRKDENAQWVQDGSVKTLTNNQFNNFSIEKDGVIWLFNQYEMGPYVVGQFEIKLSLKELGPNFRTSLLAR